MLNQSFAGNSSFFQQIVLFFQPLLAYRVENELYLKINREGLNPLLAFLKYHTQTLYQQLVDIYGVDYGEKLNRFEICYNFLSVQ